MSGTRIEVPVDDGVLSGLDFGGQGPEVLLVHGSGHNAAVWTDVVAHLVEHCRPVAVDLRGHGQSALTSSTAEQYWRDLGAVVEALGWDRPVLVGHSTGGYAVTAAVAAGLVDAAALCVVDGMVLDDRDAATDAQAQWQNPQAAEELRETFRYGWRATEQQMFSYIEQYVREAESDWLNAGSRPELVRAVMRRSFLRGGDTLYERRPSLEEIAVVSAPDPRAPIYPSMDVYTHIRCPITFVLPARGSYAQRRDEVQTLVDAVANRHLVEISANHNVPMTRPAELAAIVGDVVRRHS
ncbi:alpha/beta hydrolase [Rhodococcus rhodochrous]|uniref:alpha/beta hydrolase n=1 Tax=Rhodococcus rhodochrous TaxID=1829 RepID=UPI001E585AF8|nr:alpha/beta hydrolase [Rhodococcus rhodochrous]MCD2100305.1 alpha/beta hydrolase [Rhodococcus rhodochrous]MCD2124201.1 alpha/beta hydrolase [Rhodococcus rhodochrous]MCQ4137839.1 alpha/beta hydrolase [Rhodococcus rhodochrous]MDJ0021478.1 alpha/beta hydrolase [Rhodococcus rhodochrous]